MHLRHYLERVGMTQAEFGQLLDPPVSQAKVSKWLEGKARVSLVDALQVVRLCDGLVSIEELAAMYRPADGEGAREGVADVHPCTLGVRPVAGNPIENRSVV